MATIKDKSERDFRIYSGSTAAHTSLDFNKIKVGKEYLENDVTAYLQNMTAKKGYVRPINREDVVRAIDTQNIPELRRISEHFFAHSGIYSRLCRYMAFLYRYDWFITPHVYDDNIKPDKVIEGWYKAACLLEESHLQRRFGEIALQVLKDGCYYGYMIDHKTAGYLQDLPANYCRCRYKWNDKPAVEFNIKYFDEAFPDPQYRARVLKMFPAEFQKAWLSYKKGTLPQDFSGDTMGWFLLDPEKTVRFNLSGSDAPLFVTVIPAILDLEEAKDIDKAKMRQQLIRLVVQQFPLDKNFDMVFDMDEMRQLHKNAVQMLSDAVGINVLSTVADVSVEDLSDKGNVSSVDQLEKVERTVYNEAGVSQKQFNTDGNIALQKSIANDEATMTDLLLQFEEYAERLLAPFNKSPKRLRYKVQMLPTTIYNYQDLSKLYKEQTQIGFSKLLPQVALGQSQSAIIATAVFENNYMNLQDLFNPPQMSSTVSSSDKDTKDTETKKTQAPSDNKGGRPELPDDQKSEKTIANVESGG